MVKRTPFVIFSILGLILSALLTGFHGCKSEPQTSFFRLNPQVEQSRADYFKLDKPMGKIFFKKGGHQFELDNIPTPEGTRFYLNGKKQIKINPRLTGKVRLYTHLFLKSLQPETAIQFELEIYNKKNKIKKGTGRKLAAAEASQPLYIDLTIGKGDQILFKFKGTGVVFFSKPIIYKIKPNPQRRNIFFIALDTLRADQIGLKVNNRSLTPNIDEFLKDSVNFKNTYAQTSWTLPSFMSLFTALYEYNHEVGVKNILSLDKPYLVEPLSNRFITFGYHGGKVMKRRWGYWRGFDSYRHFRQAGALYPRGGRNLFQKAAELLENAQFPDLFLFLHTYQIHAPYTPPEKYLKQLNPNPKHTKLDAINDGNPEKTYQPVDPEMQQSLLELYRAEILAFDAYFGEFIQLLKEMRLYDNAMIVFMSDHGEEFFEHKGWTHSHALYNEQILVPLIVKFPRNKYKNRVIQNPVGVIDILPTLLSYYNVPCTAAGLDGRDLMPMIETNEPRIPEYIVSSISTSRYFEAVPPRIALMFDHYKLIYNHPISEKELQFFDGFTPPPQIENFELFDLEKDPTETINIAGNQLQLKNKYMPVMVKLQKFIRQKLAAAGKKNKPLDKEVEEQLKSLGYL